MTIAESLQGLIRAKTLLINKINDVYSTTIPSDILLQNIVVYIENEELTDVADSLIDQLYNIIAGKESLISWLNDEHNCEIPEGTLLEDIRGYINDDIIDSELTMRMCSYNYSTSGNPMIYVSNMGGRAYILVHNPDGVEFNSFTIYIPANDRVNGGVETPQYMGNGFYLVAVIANMYGNDFSNRYSASGAGIKDIYLIINGTQYKFQMRLQDGAYTNTYITNTDGKSGADYPVRFGGGSYSMNLIFPRPVCGVSSENKEIYTGETKCIYYTYDLDRDGAETNKKYLTWNMDSSNGIVNQCHLTVDSLVINANGTIQLNFTVPRNNADYTRFSVINLLYGSDVIGCVFVRQEPKDTYFLLRTSHSYFEEFNYRYSLNSPISLPTTIYATKLGLLYNKKVTTQNGVRLYPQILNTSYGTVYEYISEQQRDYIQSIEELDV